MNSKGFVFLILGLFSFVSYISYDFIVSEKTIEDISSYDITNRNECYKIQDVDKYNDCIIFYLERTPYIKNEKLVPIRRIE